MAFWSRQNISNFFGLSDDEDYEPDEVEEYSETPQSTTRKNYNFREEETPVDNFYGRNSDNYKKEKVVPLRASKKDTPQTSAQITIVEPRVYSEALTIAKKIVAEEAVIVNFHLIEEAQARRIVDFLTGTVYALGGDIQRIGNEIFLCTPENIVIDGATAKSLLKDEFQQF